MGFKSKLKKYQFIMKAYRKIRELLFGLFWSPFIKYKKKNKAVFCECCVYTKGYSLRKENWGDDINKYFFEYVTEKEFVFVPFRNLSKTLRIQHYSLIGSIIGFYNLDNTVIYGSGIRDPDDTIEGTPDKIISVRGPKTRRVLLDQGIICPEKYGDPALLLPLFYKSHDIGNSDIVVIPNMGTDLKTVTDWIDRTFPTDRIVDVIDMRNYSDWTEIIDRIVSGKLVISESLHGLIVAETYGIKNVWVEFTDHPDYWNFKYEDFFESIGKEETILRLQNGVEYDEIMVKASRWKKGDINYKALISCFPFPVREVFSEYINEF